MAAKKKASRRKSATNNFIFRDKARLRPIAKIAEGGVVQDDRVSGGWETGESKGNGVEAEAERVGQAAYIFSK